MKEKLVFVFSVCVIAFLGGVGIMHFKVFPYRLVEEAFIAVDAWRDVLTADQINFLFVDESGSPEPTVTWSDGYTDDGELILMAGGPGALTSRCPEFGCMARISNRGGETLHTWEVDYAALWADTMHEGLKDHNKIAPSGLHLFDNGDLLVSFGSRSLFPYGVGMAKFDKDGNLLWKAANFAHHWFTVAPDGNIYTPAHQLAESPLMLGDTKKQLRCNKGDIYSDVILKVSPQGETLAAIPLIDLLAANGLVGLLTESRQPCDALHLNYVDYVTRQLADQTPGLAEGDLIVSLRHINTLLAIDPVSGSIKWHLTGRTIAQHSPRLQADGSILVFDNYGGRRAVGGSRIVRLDYGSDRSQDVYPRPDTASGVDFFSSFAGVIDLHPDGIRGLVSVTEQGRILELDLKTGRLLWEYTNNHDLGSYPGQVGNKAGVSSRLWTNGAWYIKKRPAFLDL